MDEIAQKIVNVPLLAVDSETRDPNLLTKGPAFVREDAEAVDISLTWPEGRDVQSYTCPSPTRAVAILTRTKCSEPWPTPSRSAETRWSWPTLPTIWRIYVLHGVRMKCPVYDVQIAEALLKENCKSYNIERPG